MSPTSVEQRRHPGSRCSELAEIIAAAGLVPERADDMGNAPWSVRAAIRDRTDG
jgi:hypothetical protein